MNPLPDFDAEMAGTRKALERIPAEKFDYRPHPKSGTMIWLAGHIANLPSWATTTLTTESLEIANYTPPAAPADTAELVALFDRNVAACREALSKATDTDLQKEWTCTINGHEVIRMSRMEVLRGMMLNHLIHHRAQLTMYMRLNDIAVPGLYGPSADEPMPMGDAQASGQ